MSESQLPRVRRSLQLLSFLIFIFWFLWKPTQSVLFLSAAFLVILLFYVWCQGAQTMLNPYSSLQSPEPYAIFTAGHLWKCFSQSNPPSLGLSLWWFTLGLILVLSLCSHRGHHLLFALLRPLIKQ